MCQGQLPGFHTFSIKHPNPVHFFFWILLPNLIIVGADPRTIFASWTQLLAFFSASLWMNEHDIVCARECFPHLVMAFFCFYVSSACSVCWVIWRHSIIKQQFPPPPIIDCLVMYRQTKGIRNMVQSCTQEFLHISGNVQAMFFFFHSCMCWGGVQEGWWDWKPNNLCQIFQNGKAEPWLLMLMILSNSFSVFKKTTTLQYLFE